MKVCIKSHGHMTKMATMAINSKNLKKSSSHLQNQEAYDLEKLFRQFSNYKYIMQASRLER